MDPHDVIYLQTDNEYDGIGNTEYEGVTWSHDRINNTDTKYLLATPPRKLAEELLKTLKKLLYQAQDPDWDYHLYSTGEAKEVINEAEEIIAKAEKKT